MARKTKKSNKFDNAVDAYSLMCESGKLKGMTQSDMLDIYESLKRIADGNSTTTVSQKVADFFKKYKFNVTAHGIGWKITA